MALPDSLPDRRILVIAPHGDDEVLGCGGMIARAAADGAEITVAIMATGGIKQYHLSAEASVDERMLEIYAASTILGVRDTRVLFPGYEIRLETLPMLQLVTALDEILAENAYDECFIPEPSHNLDHTLTHQAALAAFRLGSTTTPDLIAAFEGTRPGWQSPAGAGGDLFVNITSTVDAKVAALEAYGSQIRQYPHPTSTEALRRLAAMRGMEAGLDYAERFRVLRLVRS
jgi:LmbE family N-acetylglucosaminyl deacetylase